MSPANIPEELGQEQQENENAKVIPLREQAEAVAEEDGLSERNNLPSPERRARFDEVAPSKKKRDSKEIISCGSYVIRDGCIYFKEVKNGEEKEIFICAGIYPIARLRDQEGKSHTLLLELDDREQKHRWPMPRWMIAKPQEVINILLDLGLDPPLDSLGQKRLMEFFKIANPQKKMRCVDKSGWHGNQFIFPNGKVYGDPEGNEGVYPVSESCPKGVKAKGSLEEWQNNVAKKCVSNSRLLLSLGAAFAAPCLELLGEDSGGFNLKGPSSIGKTKCLNVAVSVYGSPEFKRSWKATANGLEGVCALHNDCLLALDEFGQADAKEVGEISYMVSQGTGKQRAAKDGSARDPKSWRVSLLSTGEVGLEEHMRSSSKQTMAGQMARVVDVPAEPMDAKYRCFEEIHGCSNGAEFSDELDRGCREYYGTAGPAFIERLIAYGKEKARADLRYIVDDFVTDNARDFDGQVKRVARRFGLLYAALSLAIQLKVLGGDLQEEQAKKAIIKCYNDWLRDRGTTGDIESKKIIEHVIGLLLENSESKFKSQYKDEAAPAQDSENRIRTSLWGWRVNGKYFIYNDVYKKNICTGFNHQEVFKVLNESGYLERGSDGKNTQNKRDPVTKGQIRVVVISLHEEA